MNKLPLITKADETRSKEILGAFYQGNLIPAEKKAYLTSLRQSVGPYMGIESTTVETHYILDGASQIATLGLGFNPAPFFGITQNQSAWTNDKESSETLAAINALKMFFKRQTAWEELHLGLTHSGAEANELALGEAFQKRRRKGATKVLAFEGSFHGRMMVTLASTWNKSKREPFEWPGFETVYSPFADDPTGDIFSVAPNDWKQVWAGVTQVSDLKNHWKAEIAKNKLIATEIDVLTNVRTQLAKGEIFAVIAEPMQCEGGDRYGTARFYNALAIICREYEVAIVFDEVQTGFHLGRDFFWHVTFKLTDHLDRPLLPDFVTCAKKAQMGMVLSPAPISLYEHEKNQKEFQVAGLMRGLTHALMLDQNSERIHTLEVMAREKLAELISNFKDHLENPRAFGISFAVDLKDKSLLNKLIERRFDVGLLYYPAGDNTLRFRLNTAFKKDDVENLFDALHVLFEHIFNGSELKAPINFESPQTSADIHYDLSLALLACKERTISEKEFLALVEKLITTRGQFSLIEVTSKNYAEIRNEIIKLESDVYEPARQTDITHFDHALKNRNAIAYALKGAKGLAGIIFAAPLSIFPLERGLRLDPHFTDPDSLYMLDCTVRTEFQGSGLGLILKALTTGIATLRGRTRLQGRNRDRLAKSMLGINLEMGALLQHYICEDYPDFESHRDVLYYSIPLQWQTGSLKLSEGESRPTPELTKADYHNLAPVMVNKICLSNFVSQSFLSDVKVFSDLLPTELRHMYTTSGQSEAVDKVAKTLWFNRDKEKIKSPRFLTFKDHYFGAGSFLARGLSQIGESLFPVDVLKDASELENALKSESYLALYLEPVGQITGHVMNLDEIKKITTLCHKYGVKVVLNETASAGFHASLDHYFFSSHPELNIDAGMCYLGGQAGLVYTKEENFIAAPLMMISTWDGDELSFALASKNAKELVKMKSALPQIAADFKNKLEKSFKSGEVKIEGGLLSGNLPLSLQGYFRKGVQARTWVLNPSYQMMKRFINEM